MVSSLSLSRNKRKEEALANNLFMPDDLFYLLFGGKRGTASIDEDKRFEELCYKALDPKSNRPPLALCKRSYQYWFQMPLSAERLLGQVLAIERISPADQLRVTFNAKQNYRELFMTSFGALDKENPVEAIRDLGNVVGRESSLMTLTTFLNHSAAGGIALQYWLGDHYIPFQVFLSRYRLSIYPLRLLGEKDWHCFLERCRDLSEKDQEINCLGLLEALYLSRLAKLSHQEKQSSLPFFLAL